MSTRLVMVVLWSACLVLGMPAAHAADDRAEAPPAEMLLDLDVLADESFAARPRDPGEEEASRRADVLERLDWLDEEDGADDGEGGASARRRR